MASLGEWMGYLTYSNPISQAVINSAISIAKGAKSGVTPSGTPSPPAQPIILPMWKYTGNNYYFIRLAGISGATALMLSVVGRKIFENDMTDKIEARQEFDAANRYHYLHTFTLMAVPVTHYPSLTGSLMLCGMVLFCGPKYYRALTGDRKKFAHLPTCGAFCLIAAWLSLIF